VYGKIFSQMYDGTLATRGPWQALVTFQQLIVLANKHGEVDMTADAISRRTTVPLEIIQEGLNRLQEPDPESRTPDLEGRRIVPLAEHRDWGWRIVNYEHYNKIRSQEERREYHRKYYHKRKTQQSSTNSTDSTPIDVDVAIPIKKKKQATPLPVDFKISDNVKSWALQKGYSGLEAYLEFFKGRMSANGKTYVDWDQAFMNCVREDWAKLRGVAPVVPAVEEVPVCASCGKPLLSGFVHSRKGRVHPDCS
jgi:hypothetical protein